MKKLFSIMAVLILVIMAAVAMAGPSDTYVLYPISADPCQNPSVAKSSAIISVSTGTTNLVSLTAAKSIYVCHVTVTPTGTTPDFQLVTGTTSTCSVAQVQLTGVIKPVTGTPIHMGYGGTVMKGSSGGALCSIMSAATTTATGVITYVKQ